MSEKWNRTEMILGKAALEKLSTFNVAVFGIGGVGSYAVEALARSGVGALTLIDSDVVSPSNINRQLIALESTVGKAKTSVAAARIKDINPDCTVYEYKLFFSEETAGELDFSRFDYVIDAIDTVSSKLLLAETADKAGVPIISCMGTGNKLDPTALEVADIHKTSVCPLAKAVRHECRLRGIRHLKVVFSKELPSHTGSSVPGSVAWVPSVAGLIIAGEVIKDLINE